MIVTRIIGGLGNQMFQYAAGRSLALANGCQLKLDISGYDNYGLRAYELEIFNIKAEVASKKQVLPTCRYVILCDPITAGALF